MPTTRVNTPRPLQPGWTLGCALVLLAWLLPNRSPPWTAFYNELWMALALLPLAVWLWLSSRQGWRVPAAVVAVAMFASVPLLQCAFGQIRFTGDAVLATMYLLGLALCMLLGARWRDVAAGEGARWVFITLMWAALLSTHLALLQWLRNDALGVLLADLPIGARPTGNISQANHLASLVFLGLVAVWGLRLRGVLGASVAWLAAAYLLLGMAMTQSRTGWLEVALLAGAALVWRERLQSRRDAWGLIGLVATFIALVLLWPTLNDWLLLDGGLSLEGQLQGGRRPALWRYMFDAAMAAPWFGYGWTQVALAQQLHALAPGSGPPLQLVYTYAHNLWLDLLLWNGLPLGLLAGAALLGWFIVQARRVQGGDESLLFIALLGLLVHAQFEFPHAYAYFLLPAGLIAGLLPGGAMAWRLPRAAALAYVAAAGVATVLLVQDYIAAEAAVQRARMQAARIQLPAAAQANPLRWLDQLQAWVDHTGVDPRAPLTASEQAAFARAVTRFPSSAGLYRLALMHAHQGDATLAAQTLQLLCATQRPALCEQALFAWRDGAQGEAAMAAVPLPASVTPPSPR
jgi:O-Antigen ligase/Virulence factor membrane-bound polymerase, C-terminal